MQRNEKQVPSRVFTFMGACMAGMVDVGLFHPGDTIAKRLQKSDKKIFLPGYSFAQMTQGFKEVIFGPAVNQGLGEKMASFYKGVKPAAFYKVSQTAIRFGGQAITKDFLKQHVGHIYPDSLIQGVAGGFVGVFETLVLSPIESLKVKRQVGHVDKGFFQILRQEGFGLYNGTVVTLFRNVPASFIMFSFSSLVKEKFLGLENQATATLFQNAVGASSAALVTVIATNPADVLKTRVQVQMQAEMGKNRLSTFSILKTLVLNEGPSALFKGVGSKLLFVAPKTTVTMALAQTVPIWANSLFKSATAAIAPEKEQEISAPSPRS